MYVCMPPSPNFHLCPTFPEGCDPVSLHESAEFQELSIRRRNAFHKKIEFSDEYARKLRHAYFRLRKLYGRSSWKSVGCP